ncbi:nicotinate-nucleotide diphosphorylase (carboxylating) [bacterium]|nr:nicotinate-nucleotide diphosphorylase (carboxylating) [bacterium]
MILTDLIKQAILEDAPTGDITVSSLFSTSLSQQARLLAKQDGIFFGSDIIRAFLSCYDPAHRITFYVNDGDSLTQHTPICDFESKFDIILLIERSMLNLVQRLSGIASLTHTFIKTLNSPSIAICDTRKTTIGIRSLEKAAVKAGGGTNHRFGLSDMILIKENHLTLLEKQDTLANLDKPITLAKSKNPNLKAQIEIETIDQLNVLSLNAFDYIMLDNFSLHDIPHATTLCRECYPHLQIEVSGNISLKTIAQYRSFDIDRISVGALTHSAPSFDMSLLLI